MVPTVTHTTLGLIPNTMSQLFTNAPFPTQFKQPIPCDIPLKNATIPLLDDYSKDPGPSFWSHFPSSTNSGKISTPINIDAYRAYYLQTKHKLLPSQINNIENVLHNLVHGADSLADADNLPKLNLPNAPNMLEIRRARNFTDVLGTFVDKATVIGPSDKPPFKNFRVNQLFTVDQGHKYRPILNLSAPKGASYNDSIDKETMDKVKMSTVREIAQTIIQKGHNCIIAKQDQKDAYKVNIWISLLSLFIYIWFILLYLLLYRFLYFIFYYIISLTYFFFTLSFSLSSFPNTLY